MRVSGNLCNRRMLLKFLAWKEYISLKKKEQSFLLQKSFQMLFHFLPPYPSPGTYSQSHVFHVTAPLIVCYHY